MASPLLTWLRQHTEKWRPSIVGVFREDALHDWPLAAGSAAELRTVLTESGHLLPLPSEPAALANVMEIELRKHLLEATLLTDGANAAEGTERSFPDLEFWGPAFGEGVHAVDIKCARRGKSGKSLKNRIALYTGNTWFLWPTLKFSGILRPFDDYTEKLSVVVIYTYDPDVPERITDVQMVAHETWRLAVEVSGVGDAGVHRIGAEDRRPRRGCRRVRVGGGLLRVLAALHPSLEEVARSGAAAAPRDKEAVRRGPVRDRRRSASSELYRAIGEAPQYVVCFTHARRVRVVRPSAAPNPPRAGGLAGTHRRTHRRTASDRVADGNRQRCSRTTRTTCGRSPATSSCRSPTCVPWSSGANSKPNGRSSRSGCRLVDRRLSAFVVK